MTSAATAARLHGELHTRVLPWWQTHGIDRELGGVFTVFDNAGRRTSTDKYTWSQGRWAWLCARIATNAERGLVDVDPAEWRRSALDTAGFISRYAVLPGGLTAHLLSREGVPLPSREDGAVSVSVLSDLFAALGLAGAAGLLDGGDPRRVAWLGQSRELLESATRRLRDRTALSEPYPVRTGFRDGAGIMLRLHVAAELHRVDQADASAETAAKAAVDLVAGPAPMWRADDWWEFRPDERVDHDSLLARHRTPGHLLETAWMLLDAARDIDAVAALVPEWLPDLGRHALELGWDETHGGLLRYVDAAGGSPDGRTFGGDRYESLVIDTWDTKLWWVHAEAMLATAALDTAYPSAGFAAWNRTVTDYSLDTFPDPAGQEWLQVRDRAGRPLDRVVALPVKDPFHIARALLMALELESAGSHP